MRKLILFKLLFILFFLTVLFPLAAEDPLFYEVNVRLLVQDRQNASNLLALWTENNGGYYTLKTNEQIVFRLPDAAVSELRSYLNEISEELLEYNQNTYNLREQLLSSRSALQAMGWISMILYSLRGCTARKGSVAPRSYCPKVLL
ncbi:MAG: hypothetical protein B6241_08190 [Spirochaetaceae bacterium 4572_59]|nr:MAG: hypothetical protein B6241_08190 [Spirochaetaceae bacterium 4572_59]